jgi:hypothetical protein
VPESACQASFALLTGTEFLVTLHRMDKDPSVEIYTFERLESETVSSNDDLKPKLMVQLGLLPLRPGVQVDMDVRPDPPFPPSKGASALGRTKPFTDSTETGILVFKAMCLAEGNGGADFMHLTIVVLKEALLKLARERFSTRLAERNRAIIHLARDDSNSQWVEWDQWGPSSSRVFEDSTMSVHWVSCPLERWI